MLGVDRKETGAGRIEEKKKENRTKPKKKRSEGGWNREERVLKGGVKHNSIVYKAETKMEGDFRCCDRRGGPSYDRGRGWVGRLAKLCG